jgi:hypothetical protein
VPKPALLAGYQSDSSESVDSRSGFGLPRLAHALPGLDSETVARKMAAKMKMNVQRQLKAKKDALLDQLLPMYGEITTLPPRIPEAKRRQLLERLIERDVCGETTALSDASLQSLNERCTKLTEMTLEERKTLIMDKVDLPEERRIAEEKRQIAEEEAAREKATPLHTPHMAPLGLTGGTHGRRRRRRRKQPW